MHEGRLLAYGVPDLPPAVRAAGAGGEARASAAAAVAKQLAFAFSGEPEAGGAAPSSAEA